MKNIHCAVLTVGGWFDAEDLQGPFTTFHSIDKNNAGIFNALVIGPWVHGGWARLDGEHLGRVEFFSNTAEYYRKNILFPFFEQYLKGNGDAKLPKAYVFETGTNVWRQYSAWPPKSAEPKTLYFHANGGLSFDAPAEESFPFDEYVSDPAKPVPFVNYAALNVPQEYMVSDQRFADSRTDVVVYQTPVLQEDVTIAGPISPRLFVSTSGTDSDWDIKLIDVYPSDYPDSKQDAPRPEDRDKPRKDVPAAAFSMGGYQQLVRGEPSAENSVTASRNQTRSAQAEWKRLTSPCRTSTTPSAADTASWCRCRAHGSRLPTATRKPSSTSPTPSPRTS